MSERFWREGLLEYDGVKGIDGSWLWMEGATPKAPLAGTKNGAEFHGSERTGRHTRPATKGGGIRLAGAAEAASRHDLKRVRGASETIQVKRPKLTPPGTSPRIVPGQGL